MTPPGQLMGLSGVEPLTLRLSGVRSNQLSYGPSLKAKKRFIPAFDRHFFFFDSTFLLKKRLVNRQTLSGARKSRMNADQEDSNL